jgi:tetratricopeptide (TPR) repeat protein
MMTNLARLLVEAGKPAEAESLVVAARAGFDSTRASDRTTALAAERVLAAAFVAQGRTDTALALLDHALAGTRSAFGDGNYRTAHVKITYGSALVARGRYADAAPLARSALASLEPVRKAQPRLYAQASALVARVDAGAGR